MNDATNEAESEQRLPAVYSHGGFAQVPVVMGPMPEADAPAGLLADALLAEGAPKRTPVIETADTD